MSVRKLRGAFCSRFLTASGGIALVWIGAARGDFWGLVLMMVGLVPAITGLAGVSLVREIRDEQAHRRELGNTPHRRENVPDPVSTPPRT